MNKKELMKKKNELIEAAQGAASLEEVATFKEQIDVIVSKLELLDLNSEVATEDVAEVRAVASTKVASAEEIFNQAKREEVMGKVNETRAAEVNKTSNTPFQLAPEQTALIVKGLEEDTGILNLVNITKYPSGKRVRVVNSRGKGTWVGESVSSDSKKLEGKSVVFTDNTVEFKYSASYLLTSTTLKEWEDTVKKITVKQLTPTLVEAMINGNGTTAPKGILNTTEVEKLDATYEYQSIIKDVIGKRGFGNVNGAFIMNEETWYAIESIVDANGQPVARTNQGLDGAMVYKLKGIDVKLVEADVLAINKAVYLEQDAYSFNNNAPLEIRKYIDEDSNDVIVKGLAVFGGELIDTDGAKVFTFTEPAGE